MRFSNIHRIISSLIILDVFLFNLSCFPQGETAIPFLLITPYTEATGMGEAAVANHTDDPLAFMINPAHFGFLVQNNLYSYGYNFAHWLPGFSLSDLWIKSFAFNAGINLKKIKNSYLPFSFGMGYSRIFLNLGKFNRRDEYNNDLGYFSAWESSDQFTLGIGFDYWIRVYSGITFKQIISSLYDEETIKARVKAFDYGILIDIPLIKIVSGIINNPIRLHPSITPFFDLSVGIAKNNFGDDTISYIQAALDDPLPRNARAGIGFNIGIYSKMNEIELNPFSFKWTIEASDVLVKRYPGIYDSLTNTWIPAHWEYQEDLGNIKFFNEVILGKTNKETEKKKGWELNVLELLSIRGGRFEEDPQRGDKHFFTYGWGLRFAGLAKLLRLMHIPNDKFNIIGTILNHVDIRYNHSLLITDERNHPLSGTQWDTFNIFISN